MHLRTDVLREYYESSYDKIHRNSSSEFFNRFIHQALEKGRSGHYPRILELGCGKGDHFKHFKSNYDSLIMTDILNRIPENTDVATLASGDIPKQSGVYFSIADAQNLKYPENTFDRIVATCLLLHFSDPLPVISEWIRTLKVGGVIDALIPNDFGILVRLYKSIFPNQVARRMGVENLEYIRAIDHQSSPSRTLALIEYEIKPLAKVQFDAFPFPSVKTLKPVSFWILRLEKL